MLKGGTFFLSLIALVLIGCAWFFGRVIYPGYMGVRQVTFGPGQGFSQKGLVPGYHWNIPVYSKIHLIPTTLEAVHFNSDRQLYPEGYPALKVKTADAQNIVVNISLFVRFFPQSGTHEGVTHAGPDDLLMKVGADREDWLEHVNQKAKYALQKSLGKLLFHEFYDPYKREKMLSEAKAILNSLLAEVGMGVEALLLRRYVYEAERINESIFRKNLQVQEERLNKIAGELAQTQAELEKVAAEWDAKIKSLRVEGFNKASVVRSQGDLYERSKQAEGDLLVARAEAQVDRLKADALARSAGAKVFVAREVAPLLQSLLGGIVSDIDPYDLDSWIKRMGVEGEIDAAR